MPDMIAMGTQNDQMAMFAQHPTKLAQDGQNAWEDAINPFLHSVFDYGMTTIQMANMIWCGPLGIDGLCDWITACIDKLGIEPEML